MTTNKCLPQRKMLEKLLEYTGHIQWHKLDNDFNSYVRSKSGSRFVRAIGMYAYDACYSFCARHPKSETPKYKLYDSSGKEMTMWIDNVPGEYDVGEPAVIVFEFTNDNIIHGWIRQLPEYIPTEMEEERIRKIAYSARARLYNTSENKMFDDDPEAQKCLEESILGWDKMLSPPNPTDIKKEIDKRLMKSDNPETRERAEQIRLKYSK